ncbi:tetratricopeptide repeat protein [Formivibrio citricus]|uniref:tetratricopeptide repeat protein n=1 Tax=Formivibrio citricus TaxID=83765 RepID=UPI000B808407|nr:tetratricopeptide repeat protein [Formivibrio citricus]
MSKRAATKNLLPWLVLGACLALGGTVGWIWRQSQHPVPQPEPVPMKASASRGAPAVAVPMQTAAPLPQRSRRDDPKPRTETRTVASQPVIVRRHRDTAVPPQLEEAWQAFQRDDFATAERLYRNVLGADRNNRDALLGLAAIAIRQDRKPEAAGHYQHLLTLNPRDEAAQSGLLMLEPEQFNEATEAQEQYFRAYSRDPGNADLAFNLAVSLEQIRQSSLAAEYYRKALALGGNFDRATAEKRLAEITGETP